MWSCSGIFRGVLEANIKQDQVAVTIVMHSNQVYLWIEAFEETSVAKADMT